MTVQLVDFSTFTEKDVISELPPFQPKIERIDHKTSLQKLARFFPGLKSEDLSDGEAWVVEKLELFTYSSTYLDATYHFASTMDQTQRAITIGQLPLEWCFKPGVRLDFREFEDVYVVSLADKIQQAGRMS